MRRIYTFLLYLLLPFIVLRLYWKGKRLAAYRERISERFCMNAMLSPVDVWLHAVSLGEVVAATPFIEAMLAKKWRILVTTMTPTGSQQVKSRFGEQVMHQYLPYDYPWALRRFFKSIQAKVGIIMETELWPNLILEAKRFGVALLLANARISDKAYPQYQKTRFFFKPILKQFAVICAQSKQDAARFHSLSPTTTIKVLGNMKFDLQIRQVENTSVLALKKAWGAERTVLMAASTHQDEEYQILSRLKTLQQHIPGLLLIITPRHPERFQLVYELSQSLGFRTNKRSFPEKITPDTQVLILDAMGELFSFYHVSDFAFVGGSLVAIGGHNVLEPIALNIPVFCGPYMQNSKSICEELCKEDALQQVNDADALVHEIIDLYQHKNKREHQVQQAVRVFQANRGSVVRHLDEVEILMR